VNVVQMKIILCVIEAQCTLCVLEFLHLELVHITYRSINKTMENR